MGIEAVKGAVGAQSYQSQAVSAAKPVESVVKTSTASDAVSVAPDYQTQVVSKTSEGATNNSGQNTNQDESNSQQAQATMQDIKEINKIINSNTVAEFGYNEPTHRVTITIKDKETDEVIKEIPSDKALKMLEKAWEIAGILVDEKR